MKILMLLDDPFPFDERVEKEAHSLIEAGHEVHILCFTYTGEVQHETYKNIKIHRIRISKKIKKKLHPLSAALPYYSKIWIAAAGKVIQEFGIDAVHAHDLPLCGAGHLLKKRYGVKFIADLHENFPAMVKGMALMSTTMGKVLVSVKTWYKKEKNWLNNADLIIATANGMRDRLQAAGLNQAQYCVIENTIRRADFNVPSLETDIDFITIFYSGGITIHRGLQYALEGYNLAKRQIPNLRFWIVGAGSYEAQLHELIDELKIEDVTFFGWKKQPEMFELMAQSDICLIPHLKSEHTDNTSPNKIFHYFYAHKPVLVSNCDYLTELVEDTNSGLCYMDRNPTDFCDKLVNMISTGKMEEFAENGYQAVMSKYNWSVTGSKLVAAYESLS